MMVYGILITIVVVGLIIILFDGKPKRRKPFTKDMIDGFNKRFKDGYYDR